MAINTMVRPDENCENFGKDNGLIHEAVVTGRKVGAGQNFWARLAHDEYLFEKVVAFVARDGVITGPAALATKYEPTQSQIRAREIMGSNYFGVEGAVRHFEVDPTQEQIAALAEIPFSEEILTICKDTHILVAAFPISILEMRNCVERALFHNHEDAEYNKWACVKDRGEVGWHLVRKTPTLNATSESEARQKGLFPKNAETPTGRVMTYTLIGHFLATGGFLPKQLFVCSDITSDNHRFELGFFDSGDLYISEIHIRTTVSNVGVASEWKSN